jgi:hypothetical protein
MNKTVHTATINCNQADENTYEFPTLYSAVLFAANHCDRGEALVTTPKGQIVAKFKKYKGEHPRITQAAETARLKIENGGLTKIGTKKTIKKSVPKKSLPKKRIRKKG